MSEAWSTVPFGRIAKKLVNGGTPPTDVPRYWSGLIPWVTGADFTPSGIGEFRRFVSDEAVSHTATNVIQQGQLLLVTRTGVGKLAIAPCDIAISQDITGVYVDEDLATTEFIFHRMRQGVEDLKKLNQGTSINGIIRSDLVSYPVELPSLPQQRHIAEILSTLDEAIEQTEALIAKMQQVKAGMMHDLFTRGVTPDGHLRPTREQAHDLYKESPLGWIPKEWVVLKISDIGEVTTGNTPPEHSFAQDNRGIPFITPGDISTAPFVMQAERSVSSGHTGGTRMIGASVTCVVCIGSTIGKLAMTQRASITNQQINSVSCNRSEFAHLAYFSMSYFLKAQLWREAGLQAVPIVKKSVFERLLVAWPIDSKERHIIQTRLLALVDDLEKNVAVLNKLRLKKLGLMLDLLTGRVQVDLNYTSN